MKRVLFLFFLTGLLMGAILLKIPQESFSQGVTTREENQTSSPSAIIKYDLAFPGILPDHPLYKLKALRDKITAATTSDPRKRTDFYLLATDKGILASAMLVDKGKIDLAIQTALKAEHNYTLLTQELYKLHKKPNADFFKKIKTASLKHKEILISLSKRVSKEDKEIFEQVLEFSQRNLKEVEKYEKQKIMVK